METGKKLGKRQRAAKDRRATRGYGASPFWSIYCLWTIGAAEHVAFSIRCNSLGPVATGDAPSVLIIPKENAPCATGLANSFSLKVNQWKMNLM